MPRVRLVVHKTWLVHNPPAELDAAIDELIQTHGMTATRVGERLELVGGSSFKVKALGAKLTADSDLPRTGTVERSANPGDPATERVTVHLEDRLNSAFIDPPIRKKYERAFQSFASSVEAALASAPPEVRVGDAGTAGVTPRTSARPEPIVRAAGWWTDVSLGTIAKGCHVAGAQRQDIGALVATEAGIAFTGHPKGGCRWEDLADIEVIELRQSGRAQRLIGHCVRLTSHNGEVGEFWIKGRAEPKPVYVIQRLVQTSQ